MTPAQRFELRDPIGVHRLVNNRSNSKFSQYCLRTKNTAAMAIFLEPKECCRQLDVPSSQVGTYDLYPTDTI